MNIQDKQHLNLCWKVFEEELSFIINNLNHGHKIIVTAPNNLDIKNRVNELCQKNGIELVYVDCRTITLKEANLIRNPYYFTENGNVKSEEHEINDNNRLYLIDHISEIPDSLDQKSIYNMIVYSWKNEEYANVIFVKNSDDTIEGKTYLNDLCYCDYSCYGDIVFDPTIEPNGNQKYVMEGKIEKYIELSKIEI